MNMERAVIARKVHFSCGLRYANKKWSPEKNQQVYGDLYTEHGFGHNYTVEAYICGEISPQTGLIVDIRKVDDILKSVTNYLDHKFLNEDVEAFQNKVPTPENIACYLYNELQREFKIYQLPLAKIRLLQGDHLWVDIESSSL